MSGITDYFINEMLDALPRNMTVGLSTTQPSYTTAYPGATGITEPSGGNYSRVSLTADAWADASHRILSTNVDVTFPGATADWGEVGWVVVWAAGMVVFFGELARKVNVVDGGDQLTIPAGTLSVYLPA